MVLGWLCPDDVGETMGVVNHFAKWWPGYVGGLVPAVVPAFGTYLLSPIAIIFGSASLTVLKSPSDFIIMGATLTATILLAFAAQKSFKNKMFFLGLLLSLATLAAPTVLILLGTHFFSASLSTVGKGAISIG